MKVNWKRISFEYLGELMIDILKAYLGDQLRFEIRSPFVYDIYDGEDLVLSTFYLNERIDDYLFRSFIKKLDVSLPGILFISYRDSPHRFLLKFYKGIWIPIASWGRKHLSAIISLNRNVFPSELFSEYRPVQGSALLGNGVAVWSDIIGFKSIGNNIGNRIHQNPINLRRKIINKVDECLRNAGGYQANFSRQVGADGWYHFFSYRIPSYNPEDFMENAQLEIQRLNTTGYFSTLNIKIDLAMGAHEVKNCAIGPGGPYDDDSIIAYELTHRLRINYMERITEQVKNNRTWPFTHNWGFYQSVHLLGVSYNVYVK